MTVLAHGGMAEDDLSPVGVRQRLGLGEETARQLRRAGYVRERPAP